MENVIVIHSAMYGVGVNKEKDVTVVVAELVANGSTSVVACNDILGDPALGMVKQLNVKYSVDGVDHDETVGENRMITFAQGEPEPELGDMSYADLQAACEKAGLSTSGFEVDLIDRLRRLTDPGPEDLSNVAYSELQSMCKAAKLPANGSREELTERLTKPVEPADNQE